MDTEEPVHLSYEHTERQKNKKEATLVPAHSGKAIYIPKLFPTASHIITASPREVVLG